MNMPGGISPSVKCSQREWCPDSHALHRATIPRGSQQRRGFAVTRAPTLTFETPFPTATTSPTFSWPSTKGKEENGDVDGLEWSETMLRSLPQMPPRRVRMRTQRSVGSDGDSTSA